MSFGAPLGLLALLALPVVLWLHLYRRPPRERPVAGLFLFVDAPPPGAAGRQRQRLRSTASLLLEMLAALILALLLAEPRRAGAGDAGNLLLVLDDTASMGAVGDDGRSAAARARDEARAALDALGEDGRATVLLTGEPPVVLAGPRAPAAIARAALDRWDPRAPQHGSEAACALALDLAAAGERLLLLTDDPATAAPPAFELIACGRRLPNAAIARAARQPAAEGADGESLTVDVFASGGTPRTTRLRLHDAAAPDTATRDTAAPDTAARDTAAPDTAARDTTARDAAPLLDIALDLLPDTTTTARLTLPAAWGARTLLLSLSDGGALQLDDVARLPPEPPATVTLADLLPPETSRALGVDRLLAAVPGLVRAIDPATAQVLLSAAPGALPAGRVELVIAPTEGERQVFLGPFLADRREALLSGVTLDGVLWPAGSAAPPGAPLVLAGDLPLLTEERAGLARRLHLNLDATGSSLARSPDWPILASNVAELARALRPGLARTRVLVGEDLAWRGAPGEGPVTLVEPDGDERRAEGEATWVAQDPGEHRLMRDGKELARVQVDFVDARESNLSACGEGRREARVDGTALAGLRAEGIDPLLAQVLAIALLAALAADWWVLRRGGGR